jgi:predicted DNA-binding WGR domain protein
MGKLETGMVVWFHGKKILDYFLEDSKVNTLAFVRLENTEENHNKFYEMTFQSSSPSSPLYDIVVVYGCINTSGKRIFLRSLSLRNGEARAIYLTEAKEAFLSQLKKKFKDKEYALVDLQVSDKSLEEDITLLQNEFECFTKTAERLEDRGF